MTTSTPEFCTLSPKPCRKRLSPVVWGIYGLALLSGIIHLVAVFCTPFADWFNRYIGAGVRATLAYLTRWIPFSMAELLLCALPLIFVLLLRLAIRRYGDAWQNVLRYCAGLLALLLVFYILFVWGFGTGYHGSTVEEKLGLDRQPVSAEELEQTASYLVARIAEEMEAITYRPDGFSVMPYSHSEMVERLLDAYGTDLRPVCLCPTAAQPGEAGHAQRADDLYPHFGGLQLLYRRGQPEHEFS